MQAGKEVHTAAVQSAALQGQLAAASASIAAAKAAAERERYAADARVSQLQDELRAAGQFRDGEIRALRDTLARSDSAHVEVTLRHTLVVVVVDAQRTALRPVTAFTVFNPQVALMRGEAKYQRTHPLTSTHAHTRAHA